MKAGIFIVLFLAVLSWNAAADPGRMIPEPSFSFGLPQYPDAMYSRTRPEKSVALGVLFSLAVPGAGEFYGKSWIKGAVLLGLETALWIGYGQYSAEGRRWEDRFHDFADEHWDATRYRDWMDAHPEYTDTTHSLPSTKTQQYYEMIGKYDQFKAGWDDWEEGDPPLTSNRDHYEGMRDRSNRQFIRASYCSMAILANHVLSAFDAAWTIRRYNRTVSTQMRVSWKRGMQDWIPVLSLSVSW